MSLFFVKLLTKMKLTIIFLIFVCGQVLGLEANRRIHQGDTVNTKIPYLIALFKDRGVEHTLARWWQKISSIQNEFTYLCSGFLVSTHWVLTVAHCIEMYPNKIHYVGVNGIDWKEMDEYHKVTYSIFHSLYQGVASKTNVLDYDIGLIKTETSMRTESSMQAYLNILPVSESDGPFIGYGWGETQNGKQQKLYQMRMKYSAKVKDCKNEEAVKQGRVLCFVPVNKKQKVGYGDSGGPIILKNSDPYGGDEVISLITGSNNLRENINSPFITGPNISYFRNWIDRIVSQLDG